jgi:import receptor subunit TOM70
MSDASNEAWPAWKIALAIGVPVGVVSLGAYYLLSQPDETNEEKDAEKSPTRSDPEGSAASPVAANETFTSIDETQPLLTQEPEKYKLTIAQELKGEGNRLFKKQRYEEAIKKYSDAIETCPDVNKNEKSTYHQNKAAALEKLERWQEVVNECSAAVALNNKYVKALYRRFKGYEKLNERDSALEDITADCILEGFQNANTMTQADKTLKDIGKEKTAEKYKTRKAQLPSGVFIRQYFTSFHDDVVSQPLTDEQKQHKDDSGFIRARLAFEDRRYEEVVNECNAEIEAHKNKEQQSQDTPSYYPHALLLRATFLLLAGQNEAASADFSLVVAMGDDADAKIRANALIKRGSMYMQLQKTDRAEKDFKLAVDIDPRNCDVFHHRGQLNILLDKTAKALEDFDTCIEINPNFALAHAQHCYTRYRQSFAQKNIVGCEEAIQSFNEIIEKYPDCSETYGLFAQAQTDRGDFEAANNLFKKAIKIEPDNASLYVHRGLLALQWKQDITEAVSLINQALEIDPKCDFAHETMGTIEVQRGN